jgi:thiamine transporter
MAATRTRILVESGLTIALAYVLGRIVVYKMPMGGSVSLEMVPLMVFALRRGAVPGVVAGALYGLLNYTIDPVPPVHWIQFFVDYPFAHGLVGLAGLGASAWRRVAHGPALRGALTVVVPFALLAAGARLGGHFLSGLVFFGAYAPPGQPVWLYSLAYNASYMVPSALLCAAAAAAVLPGLERAVPPR